MGGALNEAMYYCISGEETWMMVMYISKANDGDLKDETSRTLSMSLKLCNATCRSLQLSPECNISSTRPCSIAMLNR